MEEVKETVCNILTPSKNIDNPMEKSRRNSFNNNSDTNQLGDQSTENLINFSMNLKPADDESNNHSEPEQKLDSSTASKNVGTPRRASRQSILKLDKSQRQSIIKVHHSIYQLVTFRKLMFESIRKLKMSSRLPMIPSAKTSWKK